MRRYLLDTTPLAAFLFGREPVVTLITPWLDSHEVATSVLVYGEIIEYLMGQSNFRERQAELRRLLREITPLFPSYSVLDRYAQLRRALRPPHGTGLIGDIDCLIAAIALERGLVVVTTDRDYTRVPELSVLLLERRTFAVAGDEIR